MRGLSAYDLLRRSAAVDRAMYSRPMLQRHQLEFLYDLASVAVSGPGLEVGTYCGASLVAWGSAGQHGPLYVIDPFDYKPNWVAPLPTQRERFDRYMELAGLVPVVLQGLSVQMSDQVPDHLGFCFIDGDHSYTGCAFDIAAFARRVVPGGILAFDDYGAEHPEKVGVYRAVEEWVATWTDGPSENRWHYLGRVGNIVAWQRPMIEAMPSIRERIENDEVLSRSFYRGAEGSL